jgi:hypothetical protein
LYFQKKYDTIYVIVKTVTKVKVVVEIDNTVVPDEIPVPVTIIPGIILGFDDVNVTLELDDDDAAIAVVATAFPLYDNNALLL